MDSIPVVRIHWLDAKASPGWFDIEGLRQDLAHIESVGWLVNETDTTVVLATSINSHAAGDLLTIAKSQITDRWQLSDSND